MLKPFPNLSRFCKSQSEETSGHERYGEFAQGKVLDGAEPYVKLFGPTRQYEICK